MRSLSSVLLVRVWMVPGRDVRARLLVADSDGSPSREIATAVGRPAIEAAVATWLAEFVREGTDPVTSE